MRRFLVATPAFVTTRGRMPDQFSRVLQSTMLACAMMCVSSCASSKVPTDEGSYMLGEKKNPGEDPLSLHGNMEVSVGYATGDFRDARRDMWPSRW